MTKITPWNLTTFISVVGLTIAGITVSPALAAAQTAARGNVTFTKDIAPALQRSCQQCHRPGAGAPMSLITYEEVRPWARAIKLQTSLREMPPWFIEKNVGIQKFKDDPSLSEEEIATIATWVDSGAPRGNPDDMPPPRDFAESGRWSIGTPDLIVVSEDVTVRAVAPDYWGLLDPSPTRLGEDRFIKAVEVREVRVQQAPTERVTRRAEGDLNYFVLHHATVAAQDQMQEGAEDEQRAPQEGSNFSVTYELGQNATVFPDAIGVKLSAGSSLMYRVHLHSVGEEIQFRIEVGFKLHPKGYEPKYTHSANIAGIFPTYELDIPGNQNDVRVDGMTVISKPSMMLTFEPHLHSSGKRMCVTAVYPDGASETLNCAGYNHNWVKVYVYEDDAAPLLPAGTILQIVAWYDNTAGNPRVVDSRNWKGFGNRSIDDMFAFLPRMVELTDEEFRQEVAARKARYLRQYPTANDN